MDTRTGLIYDEQAFANMMAVLTESEKKYYKEMAIDPTPKQMTRKPPRVGRNESCPCGSGKKFKKCCLEPAEAGKENDMELSQKRSNFNTVEQIVGLIEKEREQCITCREQKVELRDHIGAVGWDGKVQGLNMALAIIHEANNKLSRLPGESYGSPPAAAGKEQK